MSMLLVVDGMYVRVEEIDDGIGLVKCHIIHDNGESTCTGAVLGM